MLTGQILALDLAARTGWALGTVKDDMPESGSIRWAKEGASLACVLSECRDQLGAFLLQHPGIEIVVFEAPMDPTIIKGPRRPGTARMLMGLTGVVEEMIYTGNAKGYFARRVDVREATVAQIRVHFIGSNHRKRDVAKQQTILKCRRLGWKPIDDNAADALALWDYQRACLIKDDLLRRSF